MKRALTVLSLVLVVVLTGCKTDVNHEKVRPGVWYAEDNGGNKNPEKAIPGTCDSEGLSVARWRRIDDGYGVIVYCGPPLPRTAK